MAMISLCRLFKCKQKQTWPYYNSSWYDSWTIFPGHFSNKYIYTSLFHERNGSSKNTYNIINKENTISKYKVNMTIISLVKKNMTIKLQSILKWFTSTHKFFIFSRNFLVRLAKRTLGISKPNMCWQVLTMLMSEVFRSWISWACKYSGTGENDTEIPQFSNPRDTLSRQTDNICTNMHQDYYN